MFDHHSLRLFAGFSLSTAPRLPTVHCLLPPLLFRPPMLSKSLIHHHSRPLLSFFINAVLCRHSHGPKFFPSVEALSDVDHGSHRYSRLLVHPFAARSGACDHFSSGIVFRKDCVLHELYCALIVLQFVPLR